MLELNKLYLMDCMEGMKQFPDKYFELAVVDPPYGIDKGFSPTSRIRKYGQTLTANDYKPSSEYFSELNRVSRNQIISGIFHHLRNRRKNLVKLRTREQREVRHTASLPATSSHRICDRSASSLSDAIR